jgi:small subunit ribosomal protein S2
MNITVKDLLDAGVHFGHQTKRWNPRSKPYIFDHRQGVSIIDLGRTHVALQQACDFVENLVAEGGVVLFVGTKRQAQDIVREAAAGAGMPYCVNRWLGGTLTNFETIKRSIGKFKNYQQMETSGEMAKLPKKEESAIKREMARMQRNFDGILEMASLPGALFVIDVNHENIAVAEAARCGIPCVALVDTNSDPTAVTHPIPGNDDAVKSIRIIVDAVVEALQRGLAQRESRRSAHGGADLKAAAAAIAAAAAPAEAVAAPAEAVAAPAAEIDLEKVALPPGIKDLAVLEEEPAPADEGTGKLAAKKKPVRAVKKAEGEE